MSSLKVADHFALPVTLTFDLSSWPSNFTYVASSLSHESDI